MVETTIDLNIWPQDHVADIAGGTNDEATAGDLTTELKRTRTENKTLIEMLKFLSEKYNTLRCQLRDLIMENNIDLDISKKRKVEEEIRPMLKNIDVSKVFVKVDPSDTTLVVRDGYQWRKYGQKVTRNNPSPRAYYKCSFSPSCPVKKKVQRSVEDPSLLAATYEGEHNHILPSQGVIPSSISMPISTVALDSTQLDQLPREINETIPGIDHMPTFQQILVEQMANSLSKNPSFTTALASAISEQILDHDLTEIWDSKKT